VQLEVAAAIVRRVGSGLGRARAIIVADSQDMAATLASLGPLSASADLASLGDVARQAATALPDRWADGSDDELQAIHERLQSLVVESQRAAVTKLGGCGHPGPPPPQSGAARCRRPPLRPALSARVPSAQGPAYTLVNATVSGIRPTCGAALVPRPTRDGPMTGAPVVPSHWRHSCQAIEDRLAPGAFIGGRRCGRRATPAMGEECGRSDRQDAITGYAGQPFCQRGRCCRTTTAGYLRHWR
jgi:hypothetical protein